MTDEERAAIYAAMDEDDNESIQTINTIVPNKGVLVDGTPVPTLEYVRHLERVIKTQDENIKRIERQLARVTSLLRTHRSSIHGQNSRINDVARELEQKIDRRD